VINLNLGSDGTVGRQICSLLVITMIIANLDNKKRDISEDVLHLIILLFSNLRLVSIETDWHNVTSRELLVILQFIKPEDRKKVSDTLAYYATKVCQRQKLMNPEWLYVLPLLHIMNDNVEKTSKSCCQDGPYIWKNTSTYFPEFPSRDAAMLKNMK